jgi:hypothetical protein
MNMDVNTVFSGDSLKAADLQGREIPVTIANVAMKKFDNGNKLVLHFEGKKKTLVCNKTNAKRISSMYGTNTDLWIGNEITLYTDQVEFQGDLVDAIRVKVIKKQTAQAAKPAQHVNGNADMDDEIPF